MANLNTDSVTFLESLNRTCRCMQLDPNELKQQVWKRYEDVEIANHLDTRSNLFARSGVFVAERDKTAMSRQIKAMESAMALPAWRSRTLAGLADDLVRVQPDTRGLFMGYDFHISEKGPRLIEINTNAGAAFLAEALQACTREIGCPPIGGVKVDSRIAEKFVDSVKSEWQAAGRFGLPELLAIVDSSPQEQYLYPDMLMAKQFFNARGIRTEIAHADALSYVDGQLRLGSRVVDMVYNRSTDFTLQEPESKALRWALADDSVVVSPAPRHHAIYANKKNLPLFGQRDWLFEIGLSEENLEILDELPSSLRVTPENSELLWRSRRSYFFKPLAGFAGRGVYRGDKLTKRTWESIVEGDYIAQAYIPAGLRVVEQSEAPAELKYDVRVFTYAGEPLLLVARIYQGQTTNFRTDGGGLAPVVMA